MLVAALLVSLAASFFLVRALVRPLRALQQQPDLAALPLLSALVTKESYSQDASW